MRPPVYTWSKPFNSNSNSNSNSFSISNYDSDPCSPPHPSPEQDISEIVCNNICGNLLLSDQVSNLEIWKKSIVQDAAVTIAVFNSAKNTASIQVNVIRTVGNPVKFTVPPGNTLSATIDDAESIRVSQIGSGITEGKFCLEVCFPVFSDDKRKNNTR